MYLTAVNSIVTACQCILVRFTLMLAPCSLLTGALCSCERRWNLQCEYYKYKGILTGVVRFYWSKSRTFLSPPLPSPPSHPHTLTQPECLVQAECGSDGGDCSAFPPPTNPWQSCPQEEHCRSVFADGQCDVACNTPDCLFDAGDCTPPPAEECPPE